MDVRFRASEKCKELLKESESIEQAGETSPFFTKNAFYDYLMQLGARSFINQNKGEK